MNGIWEYSIEIPAIGTEAATKDIIQSVVASVLEVKFEDVKIYSKVNFD